MQAAAVAPEFLFPAFQAPAPAPRKPSALSSLMHMWEQEQDADESESEVELMVALSGMVGAHATSLDGE